MFVGLVFPSTVVTVHAPTGTTVELSDTGNGSEEAIEDVVTFTGRTVSVATITVTDCNKLSQLMVFIIFTTLVFTVTIGI